MSTKTTISTIINDIDPMPFISLSDNEFSQEFSLSNQECQKFRNGFTHSDMDRLSQMKFDPFKTNDDIALSRNNTNLDNSLHINNMNSNYYLPSEFRKKTTEINIKSNFSLVHLNIRSITNKFDHFKELLDSLNTEFKIIGLSETWLN